MDEKIINSDITNEFDNNFLLYSKKVLTDRALPDIAGCKPVHTRILWTMIEEMKLKSDKPFKKALATLGYTTLVHPHGDSSIYGAMVRLAQDFTMRYPLIEPMGNVGFIDGSSAAASRYVEMRPTIYAELMLNNYKENAVDKKPNYSEDIMEPVVLPSLFPNVLCNGNEGIAVGISASWVPHNLTEVCNGIIAYLKNKNITIEENMNYIQGPDLPKGGVIINKKELLKIYQTGESETTLKVRGNYEVKGNRIIFTSIPYGTTTTKIKEQINKNIDLLDKYLVDFNDETNGKNGARLVFETINEEAIDPALDILFSKTDLQSSLSVRMYGLIEGKPQLLNLKEVVKYYCEHQIDVIERSTLFKQEKAKAKEHILLGIVKALSCIDLVISIIKNSENSTKAKEELMKQLNISEAQSKAILDMKLARLSKLDEMDIRKQLEEVKQKLDVYANRLEKPEEYLIEELKIMRDTYGDERRTKITDIEVKKVVTKKENKDIIIAIEGNNIKSVKTTNAKGRIYKTKSDSKVIAFCDDGMAYRCSAEEIKSTNTNIKNITKAKGNILAISVVDSEDLVYHTTKNGMIKISKVSDFNSTRNGSVSAIKLSDDDKVVAIDVGNFISCYQETNNGIKGTLDITDLKVQGKATKGVKGLKLKDDESIVKACFSNEESNCKRNSRGQK